MLRPVYFFDQAAVDRAAAANRQLDDVTLLFAVVPVGAGSVLQGTREQLFVNRLAVAQLGGNKGHHGGDGKYQHMLEGTGHFHDQDGAGNGCAHGGCKKGRHGDNYDIGVEQGIEDIEADHNVAEHAAC